MGITAIVFFAVTKGWQWDFLTTPVQLEGRDDAVYLSYAKNALEGNSFWYTPRINSPYGCKSYDFPMLTALYVSFCRIIGIFTKNIILISNLYFLFTFIAGVVLFTLFCRKIKINYWISVAGGIVFAFSQYHFYRGMAHVTATSYFIVVIAACICFAILVSDDWDDKNKGFKGLLCELPFIALAGCLIGSCDIDYAFFGCFLISASIILTLLLKRYVAAIKGIVAIIAIVFCGILNLFPSIFNALVNGKNAVAAKRSAYEAFYYGMQIVHLFMPRAVSKLHPLRFLTDRYNATEGLFQNEATISYLGIIGIFGLILIFAVALTGLLSDKQIFLSVKDKKLFGAIQVLTILSILLGVCSGLGQIVALVGITKIRDYNRISVYILFFTSLAFVFCLDRFIKNRRLKNTWLCIIAAFLVAFHLVDVQPWHLVKAHSEVESETSNISDFTHKIEEMLGTNKRVLGLPFLAYPENVSPRTNNNNYHLYLYTFSDTIEISYGALPGTSSYLLGEQLFDTDNTRQIVYNAIENGYAGIYLDTTAYADKDGEKIKSELEELLGRRADVVDSQGCRYFFDISNIQIFKANKVVKR